jgi:release factor glutamine methyltransferase
VSQPWTIESVLKWATDDFRAKGIESPRLDAEVLLAEALASTRVQLIVDAKRPLEAGELARFRELVKRRRAREPVAYLRGEREFYGRAFKVDKRVLVPRPDTEILVEVALQRGAYCSMSMRALDLCTGSGCVAITLARERPTSRVTATDVSEGALALARENALRLGAYNVAFVKGDLFAGVRGPQPAVHPDRRGGDPGARREGSRAAPGARRRRGRAGCHAPDRGAGAEVPGARRRAGHRGRRR